jgi:hypothetical protein
MLLSVLALEPRHTPSDLVSAGPTVPTTPTNNPPIELTTPAPTPFVFINPLFAERFAVGGSGPGATAQLVRLQPDGSLVTDLRVVAFPGFGGEVRVAAADVTGDRVTDLIAAAGPGGGPHVKAFDGRSGAEVVSFFAYDGRFAGGVNVAVADFNLDGVAEIVTGAGAGGGPHVKVFDARTQVERFSFFAYDGRFSGGVSVAAGDINLDGRADIVTGAGPGGGPHVRVFSGLDLTVLQEFFALDGLTDRGVNVAAGDFDRDGRVDLVAAPAAAQPTARSWTGVVTPIGPALPALVYFTQNPLVPSQFVRTVVPFAGQFSGAVRVGVADVDGDLRADALFATGPGDSRVRVAFATDLIGVNVAQPPLFVGPLFGTGGVFVG